MANQHYLRNHKKRDKLVCENYRDISVLSTAYKVFTTIIKNKLEPLAGNILNEYHAGFRLGRSIIDQIFVVRQINEKF